MTKCDKCHKHIDVGHNAWCKECNKPHPICDDCYEEGIKNGTLTNTKHSINDKPSLDQLNKWT